MFRKILLFNLFTYAVVSVYCTEFPDYIKKCKYNDPELNNCLTEQANKMIANVKNGDKNLGTPSFSPVKLKNKIVFKPNTNFEVQLEDCSGTGFDTLKITSLKMDKKFQTLQYSSVIGRFIWDCSYKTSGKLLRENFDDVGKADIIYDNTILDYSADYNLEEINGTSYYHVDNGVTNIKDSNISFKKRNLDSDENTQADRLSELWKENPPYFSKNFLPKMELVANGIITHFINVVFSAIPADQLFEL